MSLFESAPRACDGCGQGLQSRQEPQRLSSYGNLICWPLPGIPPMTRGRTEVRAAPSAYFGSCIVEQCNVPRPSTKSRA
jgi:hypothetical protein